MGFDVEFGTLAEANAVREEYSDYLCSEDDARLKTVTFASDTPDDVREEIRQRRLISMADDRKRYGQVKLSKGEREQLKRVRDGWNWQEHGFEAMSAKAALQAEGATDWMNYYETGEGVSGSLANLEAAKETEARTGAGTGIKGDYVDEDLTEGEMGQKTERAQGARCDHARNHCEHGDPEACEFLSDHCGLSTIEVDAILGEQADDVEASQFPGPVWAALSQQWTSYQIGIAKAKEAAAAINEIHQQHGQPLVAFEELGDRKLTKDDITW